MFLPIVMSVTNEVRSSQTGRVKKEQLESYSNTVEFSKLGQALQILL